MPAVSEKQRHYMAGCAHNPGKMKGKCPHQKVAEEFSHKPKRHKSVMRGPQSYANKY